MVRCQNVYKDKTCWKLDYFPRDLSQDTAPKLLTDHNARNR